MALINKIGKYIVPNFKTWRQFSSVTGGKEIHFEKMTGAQEGIVIIGMNRPEAKNAMNIELVTQFSECLKSCHHDRAVRAIILRSMVPGIFCAGADLKARAKMNLAEVAAFVTHVRGTVSYMENLPMPVIAAIDGAALGGGLELALATDIRVASDDAKMGLVETKLAIIPGAGGTQRLPRVVGTSKAKELIFTSAILNGKEAAEIELVNHSVPQNENGDAAFLKAVSICEKIIPNGPIGVKMAKVAISKGMQVDLSSGLSIEEACYAQVIPTKDRIEGLTAFREKRTPNYTGE